MYNLKVAGDQRWKLGAFVGSLVIYFGSSYILQRVVPVTDHGIVTLAYATSRVILAVVLGIIMAACFKTVRVTSPGSIGYQRPIRIWLVLTLFWLISILLLILHSNVSSFLEFKPAQFLSVALIALSAGIYEETLCRGLLFSFFLGLFRSKMQPLLWAAFASSLLFGLLHLAHLFSGQSVPTTLQQVFYAFVVGMAFSVIRISTNGIWVGIVIHSLVDFQPGITTETQGNGNWASTLVIFTPLLIFSVMYLVKVNRLINQRTLQKLG